MLILSVEGPVFEIFKEASNDVFLLTAHLAFIAIRHYFFLNNGAAKWQLTSSMTLIVLFVL